MKFILIIILLVLIIKEYNCQSAFNIYKAYDKSNRRPPQYSSNRKRSTHGIGEYLSPQQKEMARIRSSKIDKSSDMWDANKVNGFAQYKQFQAEGIIANEKVEEKKGFGVRTRRRRLIGIEEEETVKEENNNNNNHIITSILQYPLSIGFLICVSIMSLLGIAFYKRAHREI